ncbi:amidase [Zobellella maritima]|uniref:amidase n=1 Tax=Zobellella maritima TaxID=2059725 RepID=UPI000E308395|nr:amidase [Zobellella maritima]
MAAEHDELIHRSWRLGATELAAAFAAGTLTPLEAWQACAARIRALNSELNALIVYNPQAEAAAEASTLRWRQGRPLSVLDGVPVTIKDNLNVAGLVTTWGNRAFAERLAEDDELSVARCRRAGLVILGKTNVPEFTLEGYTDNPLFGVTRNPWNTALTPGGSSGGGVASVAAGFAPLSIGTDGGGSIRRPASHTGLVGFKPSIGAVARVNSLPQVMLDFEVIGPIARSVVDAAALFNIMAGEDARDRKSLRVSQGPVDCQTHPPRLRILYVPRFGDNPLDPQIAASVGGAAATLRALGHEVSEGELPFSLDFVDAFWPMLAAVAVAALFERYPEAEPLAAEKFRTQAARGRDMGAAAYLNALEDIDAFRRRVGEAFEQVDVIMTPSAAALPWPAEQGYPTEIDGREVGPRGHAIYTGWVNACGHPAINLPSAQAQQGLPIGFQLVGNFGDDELLFRLAAEYESAVRAGWQWPGETAKGP